MMERAKIVDLTLTLTLTLIDVHKSAACFYSSFLPQIYSKLRVNLDRQDTGY